VFPSIFHITHTAFFISKTTRLYNLRVKFTPTISFSNAFHKDLHWGCQQFHEVDFNLLASTFRRQQKDRLQLVLSGEQPMVCLQGQVIQRSGQEYPSQKLVRWHLEPNSGVSNLIIINLYLHWNRNFSIFVSSKDVDREIDRCYKWF